MSEPMVNDSSAAWSGAVPERDPAPADSGAESSVASTATTAKNQAAELGSEVSGQAKAVAGQATQQARVTADEARRQARQLAGQAKGELLGQVDGRTAQAASGLGTVADQLHAIADGRIDEAGPLVDYARQAADHVGTVAKRLQSNGAQGVVDDVTSLARRRPGLFLLGAVGAGFLAGRLVRSGKAAMDEQHSPTGSGSGTTPSRPQLDAPATSTGFDAPATPAAFDVPPMPTTGLAGATPAAAVELP